MRLEEGTFQSFDGTELFYRVWEHDVQPNGRILILLHRGHEHSGRLERVAASDEFAGYRIYAFDNRGHGRTEAEPAFEFMDLVRDLDAFVSFVCRKERCKEEDIFVVANSVAGVVFSTWVHDYAPKIRGAALIAPAFRIRLYVAFAKVLLKAATALYPQLTIRSYVKSKFLTHDEEERRRYDEDERITPHIPARQLTTLLDTAKRVVEDAGTITTPMLILSATEDYVVERGVQGDFYARLSSGLKSFVELDGFYHGVLYESGYREAVAQIAGFMERAFRTPVQKRIEEVVRITREERDRIAYGSLPPFRALAYRLQRAMLRFPGALSEGIRIGLRYGFDSGVTLDHVYRNHPSGTTPLGRAIDRLYLGSVGWKGIRQRKIHLEQTLEERIGHLRKRGTPVRILDIAGGPARYLVEIARKYPDVQIEVRDYQQQNVEEGRKVAEAYGLQNITYSRKDAFDPESYAEDRRRFGIVIVSGIFELFEDNDLVGVAMDGVAAAVEKEGYLIYTGQPWHPQLEQIAHVLGNHRGEKWIMRRRSQYELDSLFERRGFVKERMQIDDWGIFTVSSARYEG